MTLKFFSSYLTSCVHNVLSHVCLQDYPQLDVDDVHKINPEEREEKLKVRSKNFFPHSFSSLVPFFFNIGLSV